MATNLSDDRARWLKERQNGLGGSDAPIVLGMCPWMSRYELYQQKIGAIAPDQESTLQMERGNALEGFVLALLAAKTGRTVRPAESYSLRRNSMSQWLFCTPDGYQDIPDKGCGLVQAKTALSMTKYKWQDDESDSFQIYETQVQHELLATGLSYATLAVLFIDQTVLTLLILQLLDAMNFQWADRYTMWKSVADGMAEELDESKFRWFDIDADPEFQFNLLAAEQAFWDGVQSRTPPEVDGSESCSRTLFALHPDDTGATIELSEEFIELDKERVYYDCMKKEYDALLKAIDNRFKEAMGDATFAVLPNGQRYSWKTQERKEHPVKASKSRVFLRRK